MDFWGALMFFFLAFLIMSCCGYCCTSKRRGAILSTPVVVTSATHTAPGGYPVTQMAPPGAGYQTNVYATNYPTGNPGQMPMPMPMPMPGTQPPLPPGVHQYAAPYPPMAASSMNPPPYDLAVQGGPSGAMNTAGYEKQAPYNPSYTAH